MTSEARKNYKWTVGYRTSKETGDMDTFNRPRLEWQQFYLKSPWTREFTTYAPEAHVFENYLKARSFVHSAQLRVTPVQVFRSAV